jgi:hypothetical protein
MGDGRRLRLGLIEAHQRAAATPTGQNHVLVTEALLEPAHPRAEVEQAVLHDQCRVVLQIARAQTERMNAALGERAQHWMAQKIGAGMNDDDGAGARRIARGSGEIAVDPEILALKSRVQLGPRHRRTRRRRNDLELLFDHASVAVRCSTLWP